SAAVVGARTAAPARGGIRVATSAEVAMITTVPRKARVRIMTVSPVAAGLRPVACGEANLARAPPRVLKLRGTMAETGLSARAATPTGPRRLRFGPFLLDLDRAELLRGGTPVPLRPKAFALLSVLAARPDRVHDKAELLEAVWPDVVVTEDSLTQAIH